jgi:hypothetical protein
VHTCTRHDYLECAEGWMDGVGLEIEVNHPAEGGDSGEGSLIVSGIGND